MRLKAELEKRPGLSHEETADLFGGKMMNAAQQGVELIARAKQIDSQAERIKALEEGLRDARVPLDWDQFFNSEPWDDAAKEHNARIDALLPKEKSDA